MNSSDSAIALTPAQEDAWRAYLRSHALLKRVLDAELRAAHDMALATYDALVQLSEAPEQHMYMRDLAAALLYSASGVTRIVDGLEDAGFAQRRIDPDNRRAVRVCLTAEGLSALEAAWPTHVGGVQRYFARHLGDDATAVERAFREMADNVADANGASLPRRAAGPEGA